jgi:hypothetical protein
LPRRNFSFGWRDTLIAAPQFFFLFWPAQSVDCRAGIFVLAGAIHRLPRCDFSFWPAGSIDCHAVIFFWPVQSINYRAAFFFWPAQYPNCRAAIFLFASARSVDCCAAIFSFGPCDPSIAAPQFFQLAGVIPRLTFDCCFLALRPFAAIAPRPALAQ